MNHRVPKRQFVLCRPLSSWLFEDQTEVWVGSLTFKTRLEGRSKQYNSLWLYLEDRYVGSNWTWETSDQYVVSIHYSVSQIYCMLYLQPIDQRLAMKQSIMQLTRESE